MKNCDGWSRTNYFQFMRLTRYPFLYIAIGRKGFEHFATPYKRVVFKPTRLTPIVILFHIINKEIHYELAEFTVAIVAKIVASSSSEFK